MLAIIILIFFFFSTGFLGQLVGGEVPKVWLNNAGHSYSLGYTHRSDVVSAEWLANNYDFQLVYANYPARNKLWAFAEINKIIEHTLPSTIDKYSYVYLSYPNIVERKSFFEFRGLILGYYSPYEFLFRNKNLVYSNGGSEIFK
jgi:uncharacterized membrane protein